MFCGGRDGGMHACLHGVLLGRQPERVPAHRMQHVEAAHPLVAGDDIGRGVALEMADMQTRARRDRGTCRGSRILGGRIFTGAKGLVLPPIGLPLRFNGVMIVGFAHSAV